MGRFSRGTVTVVVDVDVSANEFWEMLRDWPAVLKWNFTNPALLDVTLKEGDRVDVLPCTRVMHLDTSRGFPATTEEILLYADPNSRRIFYTFAGIVGGLKNYIATTFVDDLDEARARVTCASMFDVADGTSLVDTIRWLEDVYERQIIRGMEAAIIRERGSQPLRGGQNGVAG